LQIDSILVYVYNCLHLMQIGVPLCLVLCIKTPNLIVDALLHWWPVQCMAQLYGTACSCNLAYHSSQCILHNLQLMQVIDGRAIDERVAVVKIRSHNVESNHLCRFLRIYHIVNW